MPDKHALLSASAAERWMNCPGSVAATKDIPDTGSSYAAEGTLCHKLCELKVRKLFGIPEPMKRSTYTKEWNAIRADPLYQPEMETCSDIYVETIQNIALKYSEKPLVMVEQQVDFSAYVPGGFGTADCILLTPTAIHIVDYKHGKGVPVSPVENKQFMLYALGALQTYGMFYVDLKDVYLHVVQPRLDNVNYWQTAVAAVVDWGNTEVMKAAARALSADAPMVPGEKQCQFCKIRSTCRARAEMVEQLRNGQSFGQLPPTLSDTEVGVALIRAKEVSDWLRKLERYANDKLMNGGTIPGFKLVSGRRNREWDNQAAAFADMQKNGIDESLLYDRVPTTVPKLEKALDKKTYAAVVLPHVVLEAGKPTMVPETDPRETWSPAKADFAEILKGE